MARLMKCAPATYNSYVLRRLRLIYAFLLSLLLLAGAVTQGLALCESGEVCHACDGCGVIDPCGEAPQDYSACCSLLDVQPNATFTKAAEVAAPSLDAPLAPGGSAPLVGFEDAGREAREAPEPAPPSRTLEPPPAAQNGLRAPPVSA